MITMLITFKFSSVIIHCVDLYQLLLQCVSDIHICRETCILRDMCVENTHPWEAHITETTSRKVYFVTQAA